MKIEQFLAHHGISKNPFSEEDAQTDAIFKDHCINNTYHPTWDKIFGDASDPSTSIVFGEKGAGKTALRLQIAQNLAKYNKDNPSDRVFVIEYDDFNPFLDRFRDALSTRKRRADKALAEWKLWDHMDAMLTLGVTGVVDWILDVPHPSGWHASKIAPEDVKKLDQHQSRDLLLLAACYDQSTAETYRGRWQRLRKQLRFWNLAAYWQLALANGVTLVAAFVMLMLLFNGQWEWLKSKWTYIMLFTTLGVSWSPRGWQWCKSLIKARSIAKHLRVGNRETSSLRKVLMAFTDNQLAGQPLPAKDRTEDRYESLYKFQSILKSLGFAGMIILVDRVDEPHMINGSADMMKALLWPMLDNKFLKQPNIGLKLLLPSELGEYVKREDREFYQRARLDKQNMIPSLDWTGESLYDVANARITASSINGKKPTLRNFFSDDIPDQRLYDVFQQVRVPRHMFKFIYRMLVAHCNAHSDAQPVWQISRETFESNLALYMRDLDEYDRGVGTG